ncbi:MAG: tRNA uridine-5-carboxymethylaminomethyl(34) synthesis GTPase MnmE [Candidatus Glassbacteria bacterium]
MQESGKSSDTIAAVSTPPGKGAIAIVRMSGDEALRIARRLFVPASGNRKGRLTRGMFVGSLRDPARGRVIDRVVMLIMPGPNSYTGQDVVEFHCHGGTVTPNLVLRTLIESGCRQARRGEFSLRAFLGGRLDLLQAESVLDVIESRSELAQREALLRMEGSLSGVINNLRDEILELSARLEYYIDFPEEDDRIEWPLGERERAARLISTIEHLLETAVDSKVLTEGLLTVIAGAPNVGKSSLFNLLLTTERAIVTPTPGTTRDAIEATVEIGEIPLRLVDTAGLRPTDDPVERKGVEFSRRYLEAADVILLVLEANRNAFDEECKFIEEFGDRCIVVVNKSDLGMRIDTRPLDRCLQAVVISCLERTGIGELKKALCKQAESKIKVNSEKPVVVRSRHREGLMRANEALKRFRDELEKSPPEILSIELREAREALEELTGKLATEELLERIFSEFCVGK